MSLLTDVETKKKCRHIGMAMASPDLKEVIYQLLHNEGYVPDCLNDLKSLTNFIGHMTKVTGPMVGVYNKSGELCGAFVVSDVVAGHEAVFYSWFWKPCLTHNVIRFINGYIEHNAEVYGLSRVVSRTADDKGHGRILNILGMTLEGRFKNAYKTKGKLKTLFQYRRLFN